MPELCRVFCRREGFCLYLAGLCRAYGGFVAPARPLVAMWRVCGRIIPYFWHLACAGFLKVWQVCCGFFAL